MPGIRRVAVTRDEGPDGPLSTALRRAGFEPGLCPVSIELPPADPAALAEAVSHLDHYDWVIVGSQRAVQAIAAARGGQPWPRGVRTAAVGARTAAALVDAGADPAPFVAADAGADALWAALSLQDSWKDTRVLVPAVEGGRQGVIDGLRRAGARVTIVEPYRMAPRASEDVAADWRALRPDAVVVASPSAAAWLVNAIGRETLASLQAVVAIGATTANALRGLHVEATVPPETDFDAVARRLSSLRTRGTPRTSTTADG